MSEVPLYTACLEAEEFTTVSLDSVGKTLMVRRWVVANFRPLRVAGAPLESCRFVPTKSVESLPAMVSAAVDLEEFWTSVKIWTTVDLGLVLQRRGCGRRV